LSESKKKNYVSDIFHDVSFWFLGIDKFFFSGSAQQKKKKTTKMKKNTLFKSRLIKKIIMQAYTVFDKK